MNYVAILLSTFALLFTVFSFWWMNWRKGSLHVSQLKHYMLQCTESKLFIELPIVFFNSGALPIAIESLRLRFTHESKQLEPLHFNAILKSFGSDQGRYFATPFSIGRGEAREIICEFQRNPSGIQLESRESELLLEAKLLNSKKWENITRFKITVPDKLVEEIKQHLVTLENLH